MATANDDAAVPAPEWAVTCRALPRTVHVKDDGHVCENPMQAVLDSQFELRPGKREWNTGGACCGGLGCPVCCPVDAT